MESRSLADWLAYLENLHPFTIDLSLNRVKKVKDNLCLTPLFPVITVGGTNGKGSVCAMLETTLSASGYRVGCYTSPHLLTFNERIRMLQQEVGDARYVVPLMLSKMLGCKAKSHLLISNLVH